MREQVDFHNTNDNPNFMISFDESNLHNVDVIIIGPEKTPYENGIFVFHIICDQSYPMNPPKMKIITTNDGQTRFNPNFYADGKVCVSMLGTFGELTWSPLLTIEKILYGVSSLMTENPFNNEPGYESGNERYKKDPEASIKYSAKIRHETIRIAIINALRDILSDHDMYFNHDQLLKHYKKIIPSLIEECTVSIEKYPDGTPFYIAGFENPNNGMYGQFNYSNLIIQLLELDAQIN